MITFLNTDTTGRQKGCMEFRIFLVPMPEYLYWLFLSATYADRYNASAVMPPAHWHLHVRAFF